MDSLGPPEPLIKLFFLGFIMKLLSDFVLSHLVDNVRQMHFGFYN